MEPLTWTGPFGSIVDPVFTIVAYFFIITVVLQIIGSFVLPAIEESVNSDGTIKRTMGPNLMIAMGVKYSLLALLALCVLYILAGMFTPLGTVGLIGAVAAQFAPVWIALVITFLLSITYKRKLGLYGKLFDSLIGMIGFGLLMFWFYTALFVGLFDMVATLDPLTQASGMKNERC